MLPDEVILPIIHKWAKILWRKGLDYDELVAVGYCAAKPLNENKPLWTVASWVKWVIIEFIKTELNKTHPKRIEQIRGKTTHSPLDVSILDIRDAIGNLSDEEAQLIYMRFWRGLTLKQIAKEFNKPFNWARDNVSRVLGILERKVLQ